MDFFETRDKEWHYTDRSSNRTKKRKNVIKRVSNNRLKRWQTYQEIREALEKQNREQFENENKLDRELFEFVKKELAVHHSTTVKAATTATSK